jgi:hypothetical protein
VSGHEGFAEAARALGLQLDDGGEHAAGDHQGFRTRLWLSAPDDGVDSVTIELLLPAPLADRLGLQAMPTGFIDLKESCSGHLAGHQASCVPVTRTKAPRR